MIFCKQCERMLDLEDHVCPYCGTSVKKDFNLDEIKDISPESYEAIGKIEKDQKLSFIIWLIVALWQILFGLTGLNHKIGLSIFMFPLGLINLGVIVRNRYKWSKQIKENPIGLYAKYENSLIKDIFLLILNLIIGASISCAGAGYDLYMRQQVKKNKKTFDFIENYYKEKYEKTEIEAPQQPATEKTVILTNDEKETENRSEESIDHEKEVTDRPSPIANNKHKPAMWICIVSAAVLLSAVIFFVGQGNMNAKNAALEETAKNFSGVSVYQDQIYFISSKGDLYQANINDQAAVNGYNAKCIGEDIEFVFKVAPNNIYYTRNYDVYGKTYARIYKMNRSTLEEELLAEFNDSEVVLHYIDEKNNRLFYFAYDEESDFIFDRESDTSLSYLDIGTKKKYHWKLPSDYKNETNIIGIFDEDKKHYYFSPLSTFDEEKRYFYAYDKEKENYEQMPNLSNSIDCMTTDGKNLYYVNNKTEGNTTVKRSNLDGTDEESIIDDFKYKILYICSFDNQLYCIVDYGANYDVGNGVEVIDLRTKKMKKCIEPKGTQIINFIDVDKNGLLYRVASRDEKAVKLLDLENKEETVLLNEDY